MQQVTNQRLTGRYAVVKIFPHIHALKVEVQQTFYDEDNTNATDTFWRLASDKDILELNIPVAHCYSVKQ